MLLGCRWVGLLEVTSNYFVDEKPIFTQANDPFRIRFHVKPNVWLSIETGIPIHDDVCWNHLSFTRHLPKKNLLWTPMIRTGLRKLQDIDGAYLESILIQQLNSSLVYPLDEIEKEKLRTK